MQKPTFSEALRFWSRLGWISFGGPAGQIAIMHEFLVEKRKWISESRFLHALNYCMILPGPEAQQLAVYVGWLLHGTRGGLAAGALFVLPSMFILLVLSLLYVTFGGLPWVYALFSGLKPAVVAIVLLALVKIGKKSLHTVLHYVVAAVAFVCIFFLNVPFPYIVLGTFGLALLAQRFFPQMFQTQASKKKNPNADDEIGYCINRDYKVAGAGFRLSRLVGQLAVFAVLWLLPLGLFYWACFI